MSDIDFHMHSKYSDDGEYTPIELAKLCEGKKIKYFSIADHNSVKGIKEAAEYCEGREIEIIPAVEMDCTLEKRNLHILGYGIDYKCNIFEKIESEIIAQEQKASKIRMKLVRGLGIDFLDKDIDKLSQNGVVTGEIIAEAAMKFDSKQINPLLQPYYKGRARSDNPYVNFYWDYCSQGKEAYAEVKYISLDEAVKIILDNGGVPILAHPGNNVKEDKEFLDKIINRGIRGIEVFSSYHSELQNDFYRKYAKSNNLLITCGSDFHGKTKPSIEIGDTGYKGAGQGIVSRLLAAIDKKG